METACIDFSMTLSKEVITDLEKQMSIDLLKYQQTL